MITSPTPLSRSKAREQTAEFVLHVMTRFPLVVEILDVLGKSEVPNPGDDDIRHGCERAIASILADLSRIEAAPDGDVSSIETAACDLIRGTAGLGLIDAGNLRFIRGHIERIFDKRVE